MSARKRAYGGDHSTEKRPRNVVSVSGIDKNQTERTNANRFKSEHEDAIMKAKARLQSKSSGYKQNYFPQSASKIDSTSVSGSSLDFQAKIRAAKERASLKNGTPDLVDNEYGEPEDENEGKGGLQVEIHPLLRNIIPTPKEPVYRNPLKVGARKWFDPSSINPYLNQENMSFKGRGRKVLAFNEKGKYIAKANELREKAKLDEEERLKEQNKKKLGLAADEIIGEHLYKKQIPPMVEWWDQPYLLDRSYDHINDASRINLENENAPISIYIQHPVLINPPWEKHLPPPKPMNLTKKEMKRIRRNERLEKHKEKQDRIKLGLDPAPPPKVKLSNLMSVMTNEAIKDPTYMEMKVRNEVQKRKEQHLAENESRKLTPEQRHEKLQIKAENNLEKGYFTCIFKIDKLVNKKHKYKVSINASQLKLNGVTIINPKFSLVIVEGGLKSIQSFKNLMLRRIDWTENVPPKKVEANNDDRIERLSEQPLEDLSTNKCSLIWEGQLKELNFKKWTTSDTESDEQVIEILQRYNAAHYWRDAIMADK